MWSHLSGPTSFDQTCESLLGTVTTESRLGEAMLPKLEDLRILHRLGIFNAKLTHYSSHGVCANVSSIKRYYLLQRQMGKWEKLCTWIQICCGIQVCYTASRNPWPYGLKISYVFLSVKWTYSSTCPSPKRCLSMLSTYSYLSIFKEILKYKAQFWNK